MLQPGVVTGACALLVAVVLAPSRPACADEPERALPADPTLRRLIADSLAAVPEVASADEVVRARQERVPQAGARPDPMLQIGIQNMGFTSSAIGEDPMSFVSVMASQTFPWPGKRGLRRGAAALEVAQAQQASRRARLTIEADVRRAYLDLLLVRDRIALLDQLDVLWQKSLGVARARYEVGDGAQSDVLRGQLEINRIKQRRFALEAEAQLAVQALNRLRGHPLDEPIAPAIHVRELPPPRSLEARFAAAESLARSPELGAARLGVARAARTTALAKKDPYPDLTVGAGVMVRGSLPPMWLVTVGGAVPVTPGSKQRRAVAEGRALERAAHGEVAAIEQVLQLRSRERAAVFRALLQIIDLYDQGLLVQSEATTESTLAQYKVGKVSFASVLESNAGLIADEEGYLQAITAAHRILIAEAELSLAPVAVPAVMGGAASSMPGGGASAMSAGPRAAGGADAAPAGAPAGGGGGTPSM